MRFFAAGLPFRSRAFGAAFATRRFFAVVRLATGRFFAAARFLRLAGVPRAVVCSNA